MSNIQQEIVRLFETKISFSSKSNHLSHIFVDLISVSKIDASNR